MKKITLSILFAFTAILCQAQTVFVNEIHYDNAGGDVNEFIEIAGPAGTDLAGWSLVLYNGSNGTDYATENLTGIIADEGSGYGAIAFTIAGIQNGAPDGIVLFDGTSVVQFLSYEGDFTATSGVANGMSSTDIGVAESSSTPIGNSLQLTGTGAAYPSFTWMAEVAESPGFINAGQTFVMPGGGNIMITCPSDIEADSAPGLCTAQVFFGDAIASDPDGDPVTVTQTAGPTSMSDFPVGDTVVEFTATNDNDPSESATCTFTVTVNDVEAPTLECAADITMDNDAGVCGAVVTYDLPTVTDNCPEDPAGFTLIAGLASGEVFPVGTTTVTYEYADSGSNTATCSFEVTVNDVEAPDAPTCISLNLDLDANGMLSFPASDLADVASLMDNCGPVTVTAATNVSAPGSLSTIYDGGNGGSNGGAVYFDMTIGDADINLTSIDVNTGEGGAFTLDVYTEVGNSQGNEADPAFWGTADAVGTGTGAGANLPSNAVLDTEITLTANTTYAVALVLDAAHAFDYTNGDGTNQAFSNDDLSLALGSATNVPFTSPTFEPRVFNGGINYEFVAAPDAIVTFDCSNIGENMVEVFATDASGNSSSCMATVTVNDVTAPVLVCQNITVELDENGEATVVAEDVIDAATTFDACGIESLTIDIDGTFSCDDIGMTFTTQVFASDASNNAATCMAEITIVDAAAPVLTCPADQTVETDPATQTYTFPDYFATGEATVLDNCTDVADIVTTQDPAPGTEMGISDDNVVTLTSTDASGNTSTCTFEVDIVVEVLGVENNELNAAITMYPNPANNQVTLSNGSNIALKQAVIYGMNGNVINTIDLRDMQSEQVIEVANLATGIYMIQISSENATVVKRLIKQ